MTAVAVRATGGWPTAKDGKRWGTTKPRGMRVITVKMRRLPEFGWNRRIYAFGSKRNEETYTLTSDRHNYRGGSEPEVQHHGVSVSRIKTSIAGGVGQMFLVILRRTNCDSSAPHLCCAVSHNDIIICCL